ncbi:MAG: bifunctional 4-hydroxy-2-oxoglutarate aldolase/2-dehydro-3-deoxy-phosphogluconate aldolase [Burkholderiales bacterium]|nr:bifunctional 4-hydroxy-2-oxoglutarate aldolase/2-dehydro-3-deoxy-phosphogluconate aldolase [Burkholderiales bacterium]
MRNQNPMLAQVLRLSPVIPVLVIERTADALPLARALLEGGLKVLEITLRTPNALEVIATLANHLPNAMIAAGTVTTPQQWEAAARAGAQFAVAPGLTTALIERAPSAPIPLLPGVATASELMTALDGGFECFKFFPAQPAGGTAMLKAFGGPFPDALFCPTGGITADTAPSFLALPNVACVGGSWLAPASAVQSGDWATITALARAAVSLGHT